MINTCLQLCSNLCTALAGLMVVPTHKSPGPLSPLFHPEGFNPAPVSCQPTQQWLAQPACGDSTDLAARPGSTAILPQFL